MRKILSSVLVICMVLSCMLLAGCEDKTVVNGLTFFKSELIPLAEFTDKNVKGETEDIKIYAFLDNEFNSGGIYIDTKIKQAFDWGITEETLPQIVMFDYDKDGMNEIGASFVYDQNVGDGFKYSQINILEKSNDGYVEQTYSSDEFLEAIDANINMKEHTEIFGNAESISYGEIFDFDLSNDGKITGRMKYSAVCKKDDETEEITGEITADITYSSRMFTADNFKIVPDK